MPAVPAASTRPALLLLAILVGGCTGGANGPRARGAAETIPAASRCGFDAGGPTSPAFPWVGTGAPLTRRGIEGHPRARLVLDARDPAGGTTEFLLDTGTSCVFVAHDAPAARGALQGPERLELRANSGASSFTGRDAHLPSLDLGGLRGSNVPVFLLERPHDLRHPANVLGMAVLSGLAMTHDAGADAWTLLPARAAARQTPRGPVVAWVAPAVPVVAVEGPDGTTSFALVDTGTPTSLFRADLTPGRYLLRDEAGRVALEIDATHVAPWKALKAGGHPISLWIGLDALSKRSWTMDFSTGRWTFGAAPPAGSAPAPR